jgi:multiple sugar transport system permease protein
MKISRSVKNKNIRNNVIGVIVTLLFLFPLFWMISTSLKPQSEAFATPTLFPKHVTFSAFVMESEKGISMLQYLFNSVIVSFGSTILTIILGVPAAYGLARWKSKLNSSMLLVFLVAQMMPSSLILTPLFINFSKLHLINSYLGVILADATITIPFSVIILRTYFKGIPESLAEAARMDGCGPLRTFLKIMIPISYPGIIVSASMSLFMSWGDMVFSLTFINKEAMKPLSLILYKAMGELGVQWNVLMAYAAVVVIPIVIVFIFLQKYIVAGLTAGSVKG